MPNNHPAKNRGEERYFGILVACPSSGGSARPNLRLDNVAQRRRVNEAGSKTVGAIEQRAANFVGGVVRIPKP